MLSTCPHTPSQTHSLTLFSALFKAGKWSCAEASDTAPLAWGAVQHGELEMQDSNRELGRANTSSAPYALPACLQGCSVSRTEPQKEHHKEQMGHTSFPNTMKHPILKQRSVCLLRIDAGKKSGVHSLLDYSEDPGWETITLEQTIYQHSVITITYSININAAPISKTVKRIFQSILFC